MRWLLILCTFAFSLLGSAQVIENPVFDRTDTISFRVKKVELTKDTTYLYCSLSVEPGSWANISKDTYLYDAKSGNKYPLLKSVGLPYSPQKKHFYNYEKYIITLCFSPIGNTSKFDLIESQEDKAFNVYGINIDTIPFRLEYKEYDVSRAIRQRDFYSNIENYEKAISLSEQIIDGCKSLYGINSEDVFLSLANLSYYYHYLGNNYKAIDCLNKALNVANRIPNYNVDKIEEYISILSIYYNDIGDYQKAIDLLSSLIVQVVNKYGEISIESAKILNMLSKYSNNIGNSSQALQYADQAGKIIISTSGEQNDLYVRHLSNYATAVSNLGNYEKAIEANLKAYRINSKLFDIYNIDNALFLGNISHNYGKLNNYEEAIKYGERACELYSINKIENNDYIAFLSNMSYYYFEYSCLLDQKTDKLLIQNYLTKCLLYSDSAQHVAERINNSYLVSPMVYNNRACALFFQGKLKEAIIAHRKACDLSVKESSYYSILLQNLSLAYLYSGEYEEALRIGKDAIENFDSQVRSNLKSISTYNISKYWNTLNHFYNNFIPKYAFHAKDKEAISYLYNKTALFAKGFLLNSSLGIRNILLEEKDSSNCSIIKSIQTLYCQLDSISNTGIYSTKADSITNQIREKENFLASKSVAYCTYLDRINCHWQIIKEKLKKTDVAIEFLKFPLGQYNDSTLYVALLLKKQYDYPLLIPLFNEDKLIRSFSSLSQEQLYNIIWKPLYDELLGVENIYFSPAGLLYNIGIEYLPCDENCIMSEKYNIYRLSSTREVVDISGSKILQKVALFGGITYDTTEANDVILEPMDVYESQNRSIAVSVDRSGFDKLDGTIREIEEIKDVLSKNNIELMIFSEERGSEYNFKNLSGSNCGIIHLATHGMYVDIQSAKTNINKYNFTFISLNNSTDISGESRALTRSFLVMAGGNRLPHRINIPDKGNDGILNALEISRLDFRSVDLVVLSACQTGIGDITEEGILGLQRGFKKAGVKTIIMSLGRVDDEATKILMVEFYRNLMNGKTKHQSLKNAQRHLRSIENGKYDDPKYWASFIMLDGLN